MTIRGPRHRRCAISAGLHRGTTLTTQAPQMLFLGSFPPRECGIATFMKDVVDNFDAAFGSRSSVIAIDEPGGEERDLSGPGRRAPRAERPRFVLPHRRVRQRLSVRRAEHPARVRSVRRRRRRMGRRSHRGDREAGRHLAAHRAAGSDAAAPARRARDLRGVQRGRRAFGDRPRHPDRALRRRSREDPRDPPRRSRRAVPRHAGSEEEARLRRPHDDLDLRPDQPRQRSRVRDRSDAAPSSSRIPRRCTSSSARRIR